MGIARIRIDDVLWNSAPMKGAEFAKFQKHVNWAISANIPVRPALLCLDMDKRPEVIEYVKCMTERDNSFTGCDLHGWEHLDYAKEDEHTVRSHVARALEWFDKCGLAPPIRWVTPWGSKSRDMEDVANSFGLVIETTDPPVHDQKLVHNVLKRDGDCRNMDGIVIMVHWWERGLALYRICEAVKWGSIQEAKDNSPFEGKEYKTIWEGW